jgi:pilus assembly protein CpaC
MLRQLPLFSGTVHVENIKKGVIPMAMGPRFKKCGLCFIFLTFVFWFVFTSPCVAEEPVEVISEAIKPQELNIPVGKSAVIKSNDVVTRVSVSDPKVADAIVLSPQQIYLTGKVVGITNLTLWKEGKRGEDDIISAIFDLKISPDNSLLKEKLHEQDKLHEQKEKHKKLESLHEQEAKLEEQTKRLIDLKKKIHEILPEENELQITATHDNITLYGAVKSAANLSLVLTLAESYAPKKVINLLEVSGMHQVMLEVRVSEMSRSLMRRLGFNFSFASGVDFGLSLLGGLTSLASIGTDPSVGSSINALFRFHHGDASWTGFIDALKDNGLITLLAEPTLIALSGQPASFLAGGEYPIPVAQKDSVSIEYKQYGVGVGFTPTVLSSGKISMKVAPEVSELDYSNAVLLSGYLVPALTTRRASTVVEMADGQSFAIAGLIKNSIRENVSKFPLLGDIPILGALFRSTSFQKNESELVIIVTPHLVKPLDLAKQTLPTDQYIEPDDFEFYLLGTMEGKTSSPLWRRRGGLEGEFGHIIP